MPGDSPFVLDKLRNDHTRMAEIIRAMLKNSPRHGETIPLDTMFIIELARRGMFNRHTQFVRFKGDVVPSDAVRQMVSGLIAEMIDRELISRHPKSKRWCYVLQEGRDVLEHYDDTEADALRRTPTRPTANAGGGAGVGREVVHKVD